MIKIVTNGNLFESQCQTLVNTVNCVGIMGKGIALEFKKLYPKMFEQYRIYCKQGLLDIGKLYLWKEENNWVLNFPTKIDWRNPSKYEWIEKGLQKFVIIYKEKGITSIAFPMLGCNNGKLDKNIVLPMMKKYLEKCDDLDVEIYV